MKTWEETIEFIRTQKEYEELVRDAYFDPKLSTNFERFYSSEEYQETKKILDKFLTDFSGNLLDLGAGNGISSIAFAVDGINVTALEPDKSNTVGAQAIESLVKEKKLDNIKVVSAFAEDTTLEDNSFDIVYARQSMHHANDLKSFIHQAYRVLKPGGILFTVRDHVINEGQLDDFLEQHPLHKYYGGENAYTLDQYIDAFKSNGFKIERVFKPYDSPINYAPTTTNQLKEKLKKLTLGINFGIFFKLYLKLLNWKSRNVPGKLYSFICIKI